MRKGKGESIDYRDYRCTGREYGRCLLVSAIVTGILAWLFYRSCLGMLLFPAVYIMCVRSYKKSQVKKRKEQLLYEFRDAMQTLSAALLAGYSMENAWHDVERELFRLHGEKSLMYAEVRRMNASVGMNEPIERVLAEFAERSGCEEIENFAEVFLFAKRSGGDFVKIVQVTVAKLVGKIEVEKEIATVLAGKKLEGKIMNMMPLFILAYMTLSAGDFLDVLYGNVLGVAIMSLVLLGYVLALCISTRILDIEI